MNERIVRNVYHQTCSSNLPVGRQVIVGDNLTDILDENGNIADVGSPIFRPGEVRVNKSSQPFRLCSHIELNADHYNQHGRLKQGVCRTK